MYDILASTINAIAQSIHSIHVDICNESAATCDKIIAILQYWVGSRPKSHYTRLAFSTESTCPRGEIGRRNGLKIRRPQGCTGSSPVVGTTSEMIFIKAVQFRVGT
jgi:DNA-binding XRE family transcriptional regulator